MKLTNTGILENREAWEAAGYALPAFDVEAVKKETHDNPEWIHLEQETFSARFRQM